MYPLTHFLFPLTISYLLFPFDIALIIAFFSALMDLDHFLYHLFKKKSISLVESWNNAVQGKEHERTFIHHFPGFIFMTGVIFFMAFLNVKISLCVAIAYYSHMFLDYVPIRIKKDQKKHLKLFDLFINLTTHEVLLDLFLVVVLFFLALVS